MRLVEELKLEGMRIHTCNDYESASVRQWQRPTEGVELWPDRGIPIHCYRKEVKVLVIGIEAEGKRGTARMKWRKRLLFEKEE